jgi:hypothetical protein
MFGEEAVIDLYLKRRLNADRVAFGQAREVARSEWREFLGVEKISRPHDESRPGAERLSRIEGRLERIEAQLGIFNGSEVRVTAGNAETSGSGEFCCNISHSAGSMPAAAAARRREN